VEDMRMIRLAEHKTPTASIALSFHVQALVIDTLLHSGVVLLLTT